MVISTEKRGLVKQLRGQGKSYAEIARVANCSIGFAHKWGKYADFEREKETVRPLSSMNIRPTSSVNVNVKTPSSRVSSQLPSRSSSREKTHNVNVHRFGERENLHVKKSSRKKSLPIGVGIIFLLLVVGTVIVGFWLKSPVREEKEEPKPRDSTVNDFAFEDLENLKDNLPKNQFS